LSLKPQPARKVIKALSAVGFEVVRKHGSHVVMKHADGRITVVPVHAGENISVGLLLKIMKDTKMERDEFLKLLTKK
jgi:predicted RNA binding protein YcfA (HicA-like mRNA interferase family)